MGFVVRSIPLRRLSLAAVASLLLAACGAVTGAGDPNVAATVNGTDVPVSAVESRFEQAQAQPQVAEQLENDPGGAYQADLQAQILSQLVVTELLLQWADDIGVEATEADIEAERSELIEQLGGQEAFDEAVSQSGLSEEEITEQLRQRVLQDKIADSVSEDVEVTDAEVEAFYEENAETRFGETATARHILVETRAEARDIVAELEAGGDFAELAQEHSTDTGSAEQGGELPEFGRGQMVPEFEEAVFAAEIGEIVGPVRSEFGFHIIEVLSISEGQSLDEVRDEIRAELAETGQGEILQQELGRRTEEADVTVNPRFGAWNPATGQVEPGGPLGDTEQGTEPSDVIPMPDDVPTE